MLPLDKLMANANIGSGAGELQIWIKYKLLSKLILYIILFSAKIHTKFPLANKAIHGR